MVATGTRTPKEESAPRMSGATDVLRPRDGEFFVCGTTRFVTTWRRALTESSEQLRGGDIGARGRGALRLWIGVWVVSAALLAGTVAYVHGLERDLAMRESALKASEDGYERSREEHRLRRAELADIEAKIDRLTTRRAELEQSYEALEARFENADDDDCRCG